MQSSAERPNDLGTCIATLFGGFSAVVQGESTEHRRGSRRCGHGQATRSIGSRAVVKLWPFHVEPTSGSCPTSFSAGPSYGTGGEGGEGGILAVPHRPGVERSDNPPDEAAPRTATTADEGRAR